MVRPDPFIEIAKLLAENAVGIDKCNDSLATLCGVVGNLMTAQLAQNADISAIVAALNISSDNQAAIIRRVDLSFETLNPPILNVLGRLAGLETRSNDIMAGLRLAVGALLRLESANLPTNLPIIMGQQTEILSQIAILIQSQSTGHGQSIINTIGIRRAIRALSLKVDVVQENLDGLIATNHENLGTVVEVLSSSLV